MKNFIFILIASLSILFLWSCAEENDIAPLSESAQNNSQDGSTGIAGSYARFLTIGDFLYIIDNTSIKTISVTEPTEPQVVNTQDIGAGIESLFHYKGNLFIGSSSGLYIYAIQENGVPAFTADYGYNYPVEPCDPVVANDEFAFVTLNTRVNTGPCGGFNEVNALKIFDIQNIETPTLLAEYEMYNPKGVGLDGNTLFLCDDTEGLKVYDITNAPEITLIRHIKDITTYDVIPLNGILIVVGPDNLYQYDYSNLNDIKLISTIAHGGV